MSKRRKREMRALGIVCVLVAMLAILFTNAVYAVSEHNSPKFAGSFSIAVCSGDTLWSIAKEYKPSGMDTREFIYEIKKANSISGECINIGQNLIIPQ